MPEPGSPAHEPSLDARTLSTLVAAGREIVSELDLESVLHRILAVARDLTGARYAALGILTPARDELERFITLGIDDETRERIGDLPRGRGVLGLLIDDPRPLRLSAVGDHPRSYGFPQNHPPMESFLGVPVTIRGAAYGNLYLTEKAGGGDFDESDERATVILAEWASIAIENARLYTDLRIRQGELQRAVEGFEATTEIARAVGGETNLDRILQTIAKRARALVEARSLVVLLFEGDALQVVTTAGEFDEDSLGRRLDSTSAWGRVARGAIPERIDDAGSRLGISPEELGMRARCALLAPLIFRGRPLGLIAAFDRLTETLAFDEDDERLLLSFAASAATAVATAQTVAEERVRHSIEASERERARWARELHDETLQGLGALRLKLSSARRGSPEQFARAVEEAIEQLGTEITSLRSLIAELRPAVLDELGLRAALEALAGQHAATSGLEIEAEVDLATDAGDSPKRLDRELENTIYRVVQEALTNVVKHAHADRVVLKAVETPMAIELMIRDDGVGFDPKQGRDGGLGLVGMRERVDLVGGVLEVESAPGRGTTLRIGVPLAARSRKPLATRRRSITG
jgi:signal transduction histidine kinase